jgi:transposase
MDLTDDQWAVLEPLIPKPYRRPDGKGRPWKNSREVLNGVLWILRTGAPWHDMPNRYPPYQTCHRRFQQWAKTGVLENVLKAMAEDMRVRGGLDLSECFIDGTFITAKKGASVLERPSGARVRSSWQWQTALVFLSPYTLRVLRRTKSSLLSQLSTIGSSRKNPDGLSATRHSTATPSTRNSEQRT